MSCYRSILVALDGSADADAALRHALDLVRDQNALLTLLTVVPPSPTPIGAGVPQPPDLTEIHQSILRDALKEVPTDLSVVTRLEHGRVGETILRATESGKYDLLVMGSHGHGRMRRALLGSVSEHLLHSATIPVLLMRAAGGDDRPSNPSQEASGVVGPS